jgi:hypothetical protein
MEKTKRLGIVIRKIFETIIFSTALGIIELCMAVVLIKLGILDMQATIRGQMFQFIASIIAMGIIPALLIRI